MDYPKLPSITSSLVDLIILRVVGGHEMDQWGVLVVGGLRERESSERWGGMQCPGGEM